jgi:hypothetical protein
MTPGAQPLMTEFLGPPPHTDVMPVEETMWDVLINQDQLPRHDQQLRTVLSRAIAERLPAGKKLRRVVAWSANAGSLFAPTAGPRRFAVAYEVIAAA